MKKEGSGWRDGSVNKALALQICGPEFDTQNPYKNKNTWEWLHTQTGNVSIQEVATEGNRGLLASLV